MHLSINFFLELFELIKETKDVIGKDKCLSLFDKKPNSLIKLHKAYFSSSVKYLNKDGSIYYIVIINIIV